MVILDMIKLVIWEKRCGQSLECLRYCFWRNEIHDNKLKVGIWRWLAEVKKVKKALGSWDIKKTERPKCLQDYHPRRLDISKNYMCFSQIAWAGANVLDKLWRMKSRKQKVSINRLVDRSFNIAEWHASQRSWLVWPVLIYEKMLSFTSY